MKTGVDDVVEVRLLRLPVALHAAARRHSDGLQREFELIRRGDEPTTVPDRLVTLIDELYDEFGGVTQQPSEELEAALERGEDTIDVLYSVPPTAAAAAERLRLMLDEVDDYCRTRDLLTLVSPPETVAYRNWFLTEFTRQVNGHPATPWPDATAPDHTAPQPASRSGDRPSMPQLPEGWFVEESQSGDVTVHVAGTLDLESAPALRDVIVVLLPDRADRVVVDLRNCDFLDSVGVSVIVAAIQRISEDHHRLQFRLSDTTERVLRISGLLGYIDAEH